MKTEILARPFSFSSLQIPNRLVMAPMTRSFSKNNIPGNDVALYYRKRAEGGVGLIITEGTVIPHQASSGYPDVPQIFGDEALAGWKKVVEEVHAAQGLIMPQLWHVGSVRTKASNKKGEVVPGYAPSALSHPSHKEAEIPHDMTEKDIEDVITAFTLAAQNAQKIGFDGIELHGAHGYLIDQFFWATTNKRKDRYGGVTIGERTRFAVDIIKSIRQVVGKDFPIIFRFSQWKLGDYQAKLVDNPMELESFLTPLALAGVDVFHCSTRKFYRPEFENSPLTLAGWTKKISGKPTIAVGAMGLDDEFGSRASLEGAKDTSLNPLLDTLQYAIAAIERDEFDLIALGRSLIADPAWPKKVFRKDFESIIPFSKEHLKSLD